MKKFHYRIPLCALLIGAAVALPVQAKGNSRSGGNHSVRGHVKSDGTYVSPHYATNPNNTQRDNWSSKPNVNPYTGKEGVKEPPQ